MAKRGSKGKGGTAAKAAENNTGRIDRIKAHCDGGKGELCPKAGSHYTNSSNFSRNSFYIPQSEIYNSKKNNVNGR